MDNRSKSLGLGPGPGLGPGQLTVDLDQNRDLNLGLSFAPQKSFELKDVEDDEVRDPKKLNFKTW